MTDAIDAIKARLEKLDLAQKDLALVIGSQPHASEVLSRRRPLSLPMIRLIHMQLLIPLHVLLDLPLLEACEVPPPGWWCSRAKGHDGPCAARPVTEAAAKSAKGAAS